MLFKSIHFCCWLWLFALCASAQRFPYDGPENELTINIIPGATECFYQKAKAEQVLELEYQVIDANFGDVNINQELDINFQLLSPSGKELISDFKQSDGNHRYDVKEDGDYKFCFDNQHSHFSTKTVYFEVFVDSDSDDYDDKWDNYDFSPELLYNDTMDQIKISLAKVRDDLDKIKHHQDQLKAIESRDRNLQEHNFTSVNRFSILIIVVMLIVGAVQVIMVRSLFEEHSKLHKIFKMLS
ncbi:transmembrane emp24 domain-containing protein 1 [Trichonephila clavipes]|uniref:Transmembrane emp24 domain-containing protein 1 n=1 Tax=Trichonephila clavipes TaxID=2585209 RepID=A0A8X7BGH6_TRICX|nr:transmembrane emp24 domain-containing protein 1 [Trichonephila clavipes]